MSTMPKVPERPTEPNLSELPALGRLVGDSPDFDAAVVVSRQGSVVGHAGEPAELLLRLAPFAVGVLELAERAADEAGHGEMGVMFIESADGHIGLHAVGWDHVVFALARPEAPLGLLRHDLRVTAEQLETEID